MVELVTSPNCYSCKAAHRRMTEKGIEFRVTDVSTHPEALERVKALGYTQAPVIIAPDGSHFSGYDPDRIDALVA